MASKNKKDTSQNNKKGYQPKATARHAKITKTKQEEIESFKKKIDTDRHLAKKYESNRKTEIKALPKEERAVAKAELKESIASRKEGEAKDKEKLRIMMYEEKTEKKNLGKEPFDEDAWIRGGRKKGRDAEEPKAKKRVAADAPAEEESVPPADGDRTEDAGVKKKKD
jgi:hypothetical protein